MVLLLVCSAAMLQPAAATDTAGTQISSCTKANPGFISQAAGQKTIPGLSGLPVDPKNSPYTVNAMGAFMTKRTNRTSNFNIPPGTDVNFTITFTIPNRYQGVPITGGLVQDYVPPGWLLDVNSVKLDGARITPNVEAATSSGNFLQRGTFIPGTYIPVGTHNLSFVARTPTWPDASSGNDVARLWVLARAGVQNQAALIDQSVVPVTVRGTGIY